jgi:predicted SprT family Zn-dependent metalloprotease
MAKKQHCEKYEPANPKDVIEINGKYFKYDCTCKQHNATCLTQEMVDALSEEVYDA